jgi:hypothetical protein
LSFETCGREWLRATPRSTRSWATGLEVIEVPRSAWRVSWSRAMPWEAMAPSMKALALAGLGGGDAPGDDVAGIDVDDDEQVVVDATGRTAELGDVPRPHLIRRGGHQLGAFLGRVGALTAPLAVLSGNSEEAVHGGDRTQVDAVVEEPSPHLRGSQVAELLGAAPNRLTSSCT